MVFDDEEVIKVILVIKEDFVEFEEMYVFVRKFFYLECEE